MSSAQQSRPGPRRIDLGPLPPGGVRVRLEKLRWTDASFEVLAFLNLPEERFETADRDDPCYADSAFMYGAGERSDPDHQVYLTAILDVDSELVASAGQAERNELVLLLRDGETCADEQLIELAAVTLLPKTEPTEP